MTTQVRRVLTSALENLSRSELEAVQLARLRAQIKRCSEQIPFYRDRWTSAVAAMATLEDFKRLVPFTSKADFVASEPRTGGLLDPHGPRIAELHMTSGTSGLGQEIHPLSVFDAEAQASTWTYLAHWAGLEPGDRIAYTFPVALQQGGLWSLKASEKLGLAGLQLGKYSTDEKLDHLLRFRPHAMVISPSYLTHLGALCHERGIDPRRDLPNLKCFFVAGENYTLDWVGQTTALWGCDVHEWYGLMQAGLNLAISCEQGIVDGGSRGGLHLMEHRVLCEILQPGTDQEVGPGEEGELVITSLFREAFPVVRFRTNDRVRRCAEPCRCGRPFGRIEAGTVARYDDMMKIRGQNVWPEVIDGVVLAKPELREYRGLVSLDDRGRERVEVTVELAPGGTTKSPGVDELMGRIQAEIKSLTGINMTVNAVEPGALERFDFKVRRWTDRRRNDLKVVRHTTGD